MSKNQYTYTTQAELRKAFRAEFPGLDFKLRKDSRGVKDYCTDTRVTFVDWLDNLNRSGDISDELANRATLTTPAMSNGGKPLKPRRKVTHIEGRRWYDSFNTYHSVRINFNDGTTEYIPFTYGYDTAYIQTAEEWIKANVKGIKNPDGLTGTRFLREVLSATYSAVDVKRKKDL